MSDTVVIVSNGGPHPADKWAAVTAEKIAGFIQVDELSISEEAAAARKAKPRFEIAIADAVEPDFSNAMSAEKSAVEAGTVTARNDTFNVGQYSDSAFQSVISAASATPFAKHFEAPDVQAIIKNIITQNILDAANIQRSWAFDAKGL